MVLFRARSIRQLTITGFTAITALLIIALLVTGRQLDNLSERSQAAISVAATAMSTSRQLIEETAAMERTARQYASQRDVELYEQYASRRDQFRAVTTQLRALNLGSPAADLLEPLIDLERAGFDRLDGAGPADVDIAYATLSRTAYSVSDAIELWIVDQQQQLRERSAMAKQTLSLQAVLFISASFTLALMFIVLITRPLERINKAINRLGSGAYDRPIVIRGPRDLQALGLRLDWLRGRLSELEQQRASFLRHISHELKTPLASIQEGGALLNEGVVGPLTPEQHEISRIIVSNCHRLQSLIEDLLRHNSQNFEVLNAMPETVRYDQVIERVIEAHHWPISSSGLKIEKSLAELAVLTDPERLRVIIDNLFINALKFSPEDGVINLRLFENQGNAIFEIIDQGPGVPPEEWRKIFIPFYQGSIPPRRIVNGTGLGLTIARDYVLASGGTIELCQKPAHQTGACFRVTLPLRPPVRDRSAAEIATGVD